MFSLRLVCTDHTLVEPIPGLDVCFSEFRDADVYRVPVLNIFGVTPAGQKTCMHVHGVFPYLYVPYDGGHPSDRHLKQFAISLDKALNVALGHPNSKSQHIYKILLVSGIPFYGFHEEEEVFMKIFLYNPLMVKKVADLLLGGTVMNKIYQPYEAHIPYTLQVLIDYNLYGMNLVHAAAVKFRRDNDLASPDTPVSPGLNDTSLTSDLWDKRQIPPELWLTDVVRESCCELEVDVVAADILNRLEIGDNVGGNPGLAALWEDERQRRKERLDESNITPPESPDRGFVPWTDAEADLQQKYQDILLQLTPYMSVPSTPSATSHSLPATPDNVQTDIDWLSGSQDTVIVEEDNPVICEQSIRQVVSSSQSFSQSQPDLICGSQDESLVKLLASLAENSGASVPPSPLISCISSHMVAAEDSDSVLSTQRSSGQKSLSQRSSGQDDSCGESDDDMSNMTQELEGMDQSWNSSAWQKIDAEVAETEEVAESSGDEDSQWIIPQLDGPVDKKDGSQKKRLGIRGPAATPVQPLQGFSFNVTGAKSTSNFTQVKIPSAKPNVLSPVEKKTVDKISVEKKSVASVKMDLGKMEALPIVHPKKKKPGSPRSPASQSVKMDFGSATIIDVSDQPQKANKLKLRRPVVSDSLSKRTNLFTSIQEMSMEVQSSDVKDMASDNNPDVVSHEIHVEIIGGDVQSEIKTIEIVQGDETSLVEGEVVAMCPVEETELKTEVKTAEADEDTAGAAVMTEDAAEEGSLPGEDEELDKDEAGGSLWNTQIIPEAEKASEQKSESSDTEESTCDSEDEELPVGGKSPASGCGYQSSASERGGFGNRRAFIVRRRRSSDSSLSSDAGDEPELNPNFKVGEHVRTYGPKKSNHEQPFVTKPESPVLEDKTEEEKPLEELVDALIKPGGEAVTDNTPNNESSKLGKLRVMKKTTELTRESNLESISLAGTSDAAEMSGENLNNIMAEKIPEEAPSKKKRGRPRKKAKQLQKQQQKQQQIDSTPVLLTSFSISRSSGPKPRSGHSPEERDFKFTGTIKKDEKEKSELVSETDPQMSVKSKKLEKLKAESNQTELAPKSKASGNDLDGLEKLLCGDMTRVIHITVRDPEPVNASCDPEPGAKENKLSLKKIKQDPDKQKTVDHRDSEKCDNKSKDRSLSPPVLLREDVPQAMRKPFMSGRQAKLQQRNPPELSKEVDVAKKSRAGKSAKQSSSSKLDDGEAQESKPSSSLKKPKSDKTKVVKTPSSPSKVTNEKPKEVKKYWSKPCPKSRKKGLQSPDSSPKKARNVPCKDYLYRIRTPLYVQGVKFEEKCVSSEEGHQSQPKAAAAVKKPEKACVRVPIKDVEEYDELEMLGKEKLLLLNLCQKDVEELVAQVKREMAHKRTEHIMPLVMSLTPDEIESVYKDTRAKLDPDDNDYGSSYVDSDLPYDSDDLFDDTISRMDEDDENKLAEGSVTNEEDTTSRTEPTHEIKKADAADNDACTSIGCIDSKLSDSKSDTVEKDSALPASALVPDEPSNVGCPAESIEHLCSRAHSCREDDSNDKNSGEAALDEIDGNVDCKTDSRKHENITKDSQLEESDAVERQTAKESVSDILDDKIIVDGEEGCKSPGDMQFVKRNLSGASDSEELASSSKNESKPAQAPSRCSSASMEPTSKGEMTEVDFSVLENTMDTDPDVAGLMGCDPESHLQLHTPPIALDSEPSTSEMLSDENAEKGDMASSDQTDSLCKDIIHPSKRPLSPNQNDGSLEVTSKRPATDGNLSQESHRSSSESTSKSDSSSKSHQDDNTHSKKYYHKEHSSTGSHRNEKSKKNKEKKMSSSKKKHDSSQHDKVCREHRSHEKSSHKDQCRHRDRDRRKSGSHREQSREGSKSPKERHRSHGEGRHRSHSDRQRSSHGEKQYRDRSHRHKGEHHRGSSHRESTERHHADSASPGHEKKSSEKDFGKDTSLSESKSHRTSASLLSVPSPVPLPDRSQQADLKAVQQSGIVSEVSKSLFEDERNAKDVASSMDGELDVSLSSSPEITDNNKQNFCSTDLNTEYSSSPVSKSKPGKTFKGVRHLKISLQRVSVPLKRPNSDSEYDSDDDFFTHHKVQKLASDVPTENEVDPLWEAQKERLAELEACGSLPGVSKQASDDSSQDGDMNAKGKKKPVSYHKRLSTAFVKTTRKGRRKVDASKLLSTLSVLHQATIEKLDEADPSVSSADHYTYHSDLHGDSEAPCHDVMFKMSLLSPPQSEDGEKSPPRASSPTSSSGPSSSSGDRYDQYETLANSSSSRDNRLSSQSSLDTSEERPVRVGDNTLPSPTSSHSSHNDNHPASPSLLRDSNASPYLVKTEIIRIGVNSKPLGSPLEHSKRLLTNLSDDKSSVVTPSPVGSSPGDQTSVDVCHDQDAAPAAASACEETSLAGLGHDHMPYPIESVGKAALPQMPDSPINKNSGDSEMHETVALKESSSCDESSELHRNSEKASQEVNVEETVTTDRCTDDDPLSSDTLEPGKSVCVGNNNESDAVIAQPEVRLDEESKAVVSDDDEEEEEKNQVERFVSEPRSPSPVRSPEPVQSPDHVMENQMEPADAVPAVIPLTIEDPHIQQEVERARRAKLVKFFSKTPSKEGYKDVEKYAAPVPDMVSSDYENRQDSGIWQERGPGYSAYSREPYPSHVSSRETDSSAHSQYNIQEEEQVIPRYYTGGQNYSSESSSQAYQAHADHFHHHYSYQQDYNVLEQNPPPPPPPLHSDPSPHEQERSLHQHHHHHAQWADYSTSNSYTTTQSYPLDYSSSSSQKPVRDSSRSAELFSSYDHCTSGSIHQFDGNGDQRSQHLNAGESYHRSQTFSTNNQSSSSTHYTGTREWYGEGSHATMRPTVMPPSRDDVERHLASEMRSARYDEAYCSIPEDVPDKPRQMGGRVCKVQSSLIKDLPTFDSCLPREIVSWRRQFIQQELIGLNTSQDMVSEVGGNAGLYLAVSGEGERPVVITPARLPPSYKYVDEWLQRRSQDPKGVTLLQKDSKSDTLKVVKPTKKEYIGKGKGVGKGLSNRLKPLPADDGSFIEDIAQISEQKDVSLQSSLQANVKNQVTPKAIFSKQRSNRKSVDFSVSSSPVTVSLTQNRRASDVQLELPENYSPSLSVSLGERSISYGQHTVVSSTPSKTPTSDSGSERPLSPSFTPISRQTSSQRKTSADSNTPSTSRRPARINRRLSTGTESTLRRVLLASQTKQQAKSPVTNIPQVSQIEGPTPKNTYGFKISQQNTQDSKSLHEFQYLTIMSMELHIRTRGDLQPDPEFDSICALFYAIQYDVPPDKGNRRELGLLAVSQLPTRRAHSSDQPSKSHADNNCSSYLTLLQRSGVTDLDVTYVDDESCLIEEFVKVIKSQDPDILVGYETQQKSWGYLVQRAANLSVHLLPKLSRTPDSCRKPSTEKDQDNYGGENVSELRIPGRIVLNLWRILRLEVTLNIYSYENVVYHVLHQRVPHFTLQTLTEWYDHHSDLYRWSTLRYYSGRVQGNIDIMDQLDIIAQTSEFARVFGIEFYHVLSRGSQYRVESMMLRVAKPMNYIPVSPSVQQRARMRAPECIPLTMEPESSFYNHPVVVVDFQSLYPSIMIAYNYCFSTCLGRVSQLEKANEGPFDFGCTSLNITPSLLKKYEKDITICPNGVVFVRQHIRKGVISAMVEEILKTRLMVKKAMKEYKGDKTMERLLHARQLGLKLIANVTFGYTAANFSGRMPCVEVGDSIVTKARETLERAIHLVEDTPKWGAKVIYGDTDSMFILLEGRSKDQAFKIGEEIASAVTASNPKPVKLRFEKVYLPCVLQSKKRYVGFMYETPNQKEPTFDAKGIETVRRDTCSAVSKILEKSVKLLFSSRDISQVKAYVQRQCVKLMEGRASVQDCVFAREYRGMAGYKPGVCIPALEIARRRLSHDRRAEPLPGERVPYVIVYGSPGLPLIQLVKEPSELVKDPSLRINAPYYINKQILPPLSRIFTLLGVDVFSWYADLPKVYRAVPQSYHSTDTKKGTISQYFASLNCPVCDTTTKHGLCEQCKSDPQKTAVILNSRIRLYERTYSHLKEICSTCQGWQDSQDLCVSLDCPNMFRLVRATREKAQIPELMVLLHKLTPQ